MPVKILTREEVEKLVKEVAWKLLEESGLLKRVSDLEASVNKLKAAASTQPPPPKPEPTPKALLADLGEKAKLFDVDLRGDPAILRPKHWLRPEDFRAIGELVKRHGGSWSPEKRAFTLKKAPPNRASPSVE